VQDHVLDNAAWHALTGRQQRFALGEGTFRLFRPEFSPIAAIDPVAPESLRALVAWLAPGAGVGLVTAARMPPPPATATVASTGPLLQMLAEDAREVPASAELAIMGENDVDDIQELVALTRPGPFAARTAELGRFLGIRVDGRLAAIAGERLWLDGFTEVSAVCTHPEHRRKGYAAMLVSAAARSILARGERPFLHVLPDNAAAIAAYTALGFAPRRTMRLTLLTRNPG